MSTLSFITEMCNMFIVPHWMKMYMFKFSRRHDRLVICPVCLFWPSASLSNVNANFFQMTFISLAVWEQYPSFWNLYVLIKKVIGRVPIIQSRLHRNSCHSNLYISWCEAAWDITAAGVRPHIRRVFCTACVGYFPLICPLNFMSLFVVNVIFWRSPHLFLSFPKATFLSSRLILFRMIFLVLISIFPPFFSSICTIWALPWTLPFWLTKQITGNKIFSCHPKNF